MLVKNSGKMVIRSKRMLFCKTAPPASPEIVIPDQASPFAIASHCVMLLALALATAYAVAIIRRAGVLLFFWHTHTAVQTEAEPGGHI
jgi:hypothetical protein